MNKGIVMDIKKHRVVVLTPDGEFITFKRKSHSYIIGQEVSFNEQEQRVPRFSIPSFLKPASLLVACFLCVFLFFYNQPEEKALAYVSVDINPSLEASVTKDLRVIELRACNDDGKRILKEMKEWKNQPFQDVVRTIVKQSQEDGYLTNDKQVMLTSVAKDNSLEPQLEKAMQALMKEYEAKHVAVVYQESTMQVRENAQKAGIGTGAYIKQENEKKKSLVPPPSNQEQQPPEVQSQPDSPPDASSNSSSVKEERHEVQEQKEQQQSREQQPQQPKRNNGHQEGNNDKEYKQEYKEQKKEDKQENKEYKQENKENKQEYKQENKESKQEYKQEKKEYKQEYKEQKKEGK